jgi:hypothetical protein
MEREGGGYIVVGATEQGQEGSWQRERERKNKVAFPFLALALFIFQVVPLAVLA